MLKCSFNLPSSLYMIDSSRTGRNKRIFYNTLTGWRTCGDKSKFVDSIKNDASVKVVSQVDGHITGFTHTEIYSDNLSIAGQYPWFIVNILIKTTLNSRKSFLAACNMVICGLI